MECNARTTPQYFDGSSEAMACTLISCGTGALESHQPIYELDRESPTDPPPDSLRYCGPKDRNSVFNHSPKTPMHMRSVPILSSNVEDQSVILGLCRDQILSWPRKGSFPAETLTTFVKLWYHITGPSPKAETKDLG